MRRRCRNLYYIFFLNDIWGDCTRRKGKSLRKALIHCFLSAPTFPIVLKNRCIAMRCTGRNTAYELTNHKTRNRDSHTL